MTIDNPQEQAKSQEVDPRLMHSGNLGLEQPVIESEQPLEDAKHSLAPAPDTTQQLPEYLQSEPAARAVNARPQKPKTSIPLWAKIAAPITAAAALGGGLVAMSGSGSNNSERANANAPSALSTEDKSSNDTASIEQTPIPQPGTELPNSPDTPVLINQIFEKINHAYKTGDLNYLNDALLPDRTKGLSGLQTPVGQYFSKDVELKQLNASNYAQVYGKDPDGALQLRTETLLADTSNPSIRKAVIAVTSIDTLGKGEKPLGTQYWVVFTKPDAQLGGEFLASTQALSGKDQADQITQETLKNWQIGSLANA
jgi:hypothetical protein